MCRPMGNTETPKTVSNKHGTLSHCCYRLFKHVHPLVTNRLFPIPLLHTNKSRTPGLPKRLPRVTIRVADSRNNESRDIHERNTFRYF